MSACKIDDYQMQKKYFAGLEQNSIKIIKHELQFDFFMTENESEVDRLMRITEEIRDSTGKVRRKLFAENSLLKKKMIDLEARLEHIERGLCYS